MSLFIRHEQDNNYNIHGDAPVKIYTLSYGYGTPSKEHRISPPVLDCRSK